MYTVTNNYSYNSTVSGSLSFSFLFLIFVLFLLPKKQVPWPLIILVKVKDGIRLKTDSLGRPTWASFHIGVTEPNI